MRNIILVMSDQHSACATSMSGPIKCTPHLEEIAKRSQYFENAYCNNPLCVPSRMSFLSGKSSSDLGIYDNNVFLPSNIETIADHMNQQGYRTVLVGRMHFKADDQKHGFQERYVGDITTQWWNQKRTDLGAFYGTMQVDGCLNTFGYGNSPVQEYDEVVCHKAMELLKEKDDRPLFMIIGLYGPHFPYCVQKEFFDHYYEQDLHLEDRDLSCWDEYTSMQMEADESTLRHIRSAYYGLIEKMDHMIHELHQAIRQTDEDSIFIYTSDHGDQMGKRHLFGKKTCYEESIKIPLIVEDLQKPAMRHTNAVSLLNLHAYLCEIAGLTPQMPTLTNDEPVLVQSLIKHEGKAEIEQAVIYDRFKYVAYRGKRRLIDLDHDLNEEIDVKDQYPQIAEMLEKSLCDERIAMKNYDQRIAEMNKRKAEFQEHPQEDWIRYRISKEAVEAPHRRDHESI